MDNNYKLIILISSAALFVIGLFTGGILKSGSFHDISGVLSTAFFIPGMIVLPAGCIFLLLKGKKPWVTFAVATGGALLLLSLLFLALYYIF